MIGSDIDLCRLWIGYQMTHEGNWSNIHINHVKPFPSFYIAKDEVLHEAFN